MHKIIRRLFSQNLKQFNNLQLLNEHLMATKPVYTLVYFRAGWNPLCKHTDLQIKTLANKNLHWAIINIDTDISQAQGIAYHYKITAEPQYVLCLYGDEAARQIGKSSQKLQQKLDRIQQISKDIPGVNIDNRWRPYGSNAILYFKQHIAPRRYMHV